MAMRASKENATIAIEQADAMLAEAKTHMMEKGNPLSRMVVYHRTLMNFLTAAKRKLPSDAAYQRERQRKRK